MTDRGMSSLLLVLGVRAPRRAVCDTCGRAVRVVEYGLPSGMRFILHFVRKGGPTCAGSFKKSGGA